MPTPNERIFALAHFLHEELDYTHPDPAHGQCSMCRERAERILEMLDKLPETVVTDVELCQ